MVYTCPDGNPIGAGVTTPNATWKLNCGHCVTEVPGYVWATIPPPEATFDWDTYFNATAAPAYTATPNSPTQAPGEPIFWVNEIQVPPDVAYSGLEKGQGDIWVGSSGVFPITFGVSSQIHIDEWVSHNQYIGGSISIVFAKSDNYENALGYDVDILESNIPSLASGTQIHYTAFNPVSYIVESIGGGNEIRNKDYAIKYNVTIYGENTAFGERPQFRSYYDMGYGYYTSGVASHTWTFYEGEIPGPPPASNCDAVNGIGAPGDPDNLFDSKWFSLPYIGVGVGQCFGLEQITIDLTFLQTFVQSLPDSISTPGFEICLVPIALGSVNFFGIPIDFDSWAIILAGVLMFKVLTRF